MDIKDLREEYAAYQKRTSRWLTELETKYADEIDPHEAVESAEVMVLKAQVNSLLEQLHQKEAVIKYQEVGKCNSVLTITKSANTDRLGNPYVVPIKWNKLSDVVGLPDPEEALTANFQMYEYLRQQHDN